MSYLVLARKLRPPRFKDLVGQSHISKTLINAIRSDRVAHAFLFTGPRGTGKTSCARILTKALNCLAPVEHEPCNACENCLEINQGIATDIIEIDAASNRGIEHIRELRENVKFSPAKCKFKTYIIDEVHMLTTESFNALLKTLEEPPAHVKFILATTDHHKIPTTVISRCQRYDFSNISVPEMVTYLKSVVQSEAIPVSDSALKMIAKSATGGMRDALTTLDMLVSFSSEQIDDEQVISILGLNDVRELDSLLEAIIDKNVTQVMSLFQNLVDKGRSIARIVIDLMGVVKDLSLVKTVEVAELKWHDFLPDQLELYQRLADKVTIGTLQQYFQIILDIEGQIKRSTQAKICVEMGLMKLCSVESLAGVAEIITALRDSSKKKKLDYQLTSNENEFSEWVKEPDNSGSPEKREQQHRSACTTPLEINLPPSDRPGILGERQQSPTDADLISGEKENATFDLREKSETPASEIPIISENKATVSDQWRDFVDEVGKHGDIALISLLRNSVVLELNDKNLVIGYQNLQVFTETKRAKIAKIARRFFNESISIIFKESDAGLDDSLRVKHDHAKAREIEEIKAKARVDAHALEVLKLFPDAEITDITILDKK
ncbi:MAG: DNA polymerase III subunit gamma/tau [SAR324 cluster bacterium]|nr:DNA polymerase III subunit gamma/tau [SAR324 cluster bacterium]